MVSLQKLELDFSNFELHELVEKFSKEELPVWARKVLSFIAQYSLKTDMTFSTSGTTGEPKEHVFSIGQLNYSANNTNRYFLLKKGDSVLLPLSVDFIAGKLMVVRSIVGKLKLTVVEPSSNPLKVIAVNEYFHFCPVVPMQVRKLLQTGRIKQLEKLLVGGGVLDGQSQEQLVTSRISVWASFGMTETLTHFALKRVSPVRDLFFTCLSDFHVSVNESSCLEVHNDKFFKEKLVTKDIIQLKTGSTSSFTWKGRIDNVINSGGIKMYPEEIEEKLKQDPIFNFEFVIVSQINDVFGEVLAFCYTDVTISPDKVKAAAKILLSPFEVPKQYVLISSFEKTNSGKIKRNLIKLN